MQPFPTNILLSNWQVYFTVYGKLKHEFASGTDGQLSVAGNVLAAVGAGTASAIVTNPLWVVKIRFQVLLFFFYFTLLL
jgi:solute carrier family 25 (mitochondrial folate transporter), member 32